MRPDGASGIEVDLGVRSKLCWPNVTDIPFIDVALGNFPGLD